MPEAKKPECELIGKDGNIFNLGAIAARALKRAGQHVEAKEMVNRIFSKAGDYDEALRIVMEYVDVN